MESCDHKTVKIYHNDNPIYHSDNKGDQHQHNENISIPQSTTTL